MKTPKRALIVDDEDTAREFLRDLLAAHPEVEVVGEADNVIEAISLFNALRPDLIFLDVQMPKRDGFSMLPELRPVPDVIFVTAYDCFAVKAFEVNAVDFLVKPIHADRLALALARLSRPANRKAKPFAHDDRVFLYSDLEMRVVLASEITHIQAEGNYARVHVANKGSMFIRRKMREWVQLLPANIFLRTDRSHIINIRAVKEMIPQPREHAAIYFTGAEGSTELTRRAARRLRHALREIVIS